MDQLYDSLTGSLNEDDEILEHIRQKEETHRAFHERNPRGKAAWLASVYNKKRQTGSYRVGSAEILNYVKKIFEQPESVKSDFEEQSGLEQTVPEQLEELDIPEVKAVKSRSAATGRYRNEFEQDVVTYIFGTDEENEWIEYTGLQERKTDKDFIPPR